jgi:hypothetical protein
MKNPKRPPNLDSVWLKIERAENHMTSLEKDIERVFPRHRYTVTPEIHDNGLRHVFKADNPPVVPPMWSLMVADLIHNLRTSLDHLAHQLVLASKGSPNIHTSFPVRDRPDRAARTWHHPLNGERVLPRIAGGVTEDIRKVLEVVQPYSGAKRNHGIDLLRDLDNIDKHRRLVVVAAATSSTISSAIGGDPLAPPPSTTKFTHNPIEQGSVIAIVQYERPYLKPDPNLYFIPEIAFDEHDDRVHQDPLRIVTADLFDLVRDVVLPQFQQFFPN